MVWMRAQKSWFVVLGIDRKPLANIMLMDPLALD